MKLKNQDEKTQRKEFEANHNLVGFFNLLLQIDKRNNPHLYKNQSRKSNENNKHNLNAQI